MWLRVTLVRTGVSGRYIAATIINVKIISELGSLAVTITLVFLRSMLQLLITVKVVPSSVILFTLMTETLRSSETTVLTRTTRCHIPEGGIVREISTPKSRVATRLRFGPTLYSMCGFLWCAPDTCWWYPDICNRRQRGVCSYVLGSCSGVTELLTFFAWFSEKNRDNSPPPKKKILIDWFL
jgi:hypothetical protein